MLNSQAMTTRYSISSVVTYPTHLPLYPGRPIIPSHRMRARGCVLFLFLQILRFSHCGAGWPADRLRTNRQAAGGRFIETETHKPCRPRRSSWLFSQHPVEKRGHLIGENIGSRTWEQIPTCNIFSALCSTAFEKPLLCHMRTGKR